MSSKPETVFRKKAQEDIDSLPNTYRFTVQQIAKKGDPDNLLCVLGHFVGIEYKKSERDKPTRLQIHKLNKIRDAGGSTFVACPENWSEIFEELKRLADHHAYQSAMEEE